MRRHHGVTFRRKTASSDSRLTITSNPRNFFSNSLVIPSVVVSFFPSLSIDSNDQNFCSIFYLIFFEKMLSEKSKLI